MPGFPAKTQLQPNPLSVYCQFHAYCRGGQARWTLALGPARNTWIHLCDACVRSMITLLPDGLLILAVQVADERGLVSKALGEVAVAPRAMEEAPATLWSPQPPVSPVTQESVLAYLEAHADDEEFMAEVAEALEGEPERDLTVIPVMVEPEREPGPPWPNQDLPPTPYPGTAETPADPAPAPAEARKATTRKRKPRPKPRTKAQK